jgi:hypothetical protein
MRFVSARRGGFRVYAVSGVNTVSFGISATAAARRGLLGFAVERIDPTEGERSVMPGYKVFRSVIPQPDPTTAVSTWEHPIQSLVWDDFTGKPDREYQYLFHPVRGRPDALTRAGPVPITVRTEPLFTTGHGHDVFFNRGVASSQAYRRRFGDQRPDQLAPALRAEAIQWLTRDLDEALIGFVNAAITGDTLLGCFYEFRFAPVLDAFRAAIKRGVDVRLLVDGKINGPGGLEPGSFPRTDNVEAIDAAGIPRANVTWREARSSAIAHNKFMVRVAGGHEPTEVWTGSTNLSLGGLAGQTNVGHWVRDPAVATVFRSYWDLLGTDPGGRRGQPAGEVRRANAAFRAAVTALTPAPPTGRAGLAVGTSVVFSPRSDLTALDLYTRLLDADTTSWAGMTLAFGVPKHIRAALLDNTAADHVTFLLLESADGGRPRLTARQNLYTAWGTSLPDGLHRWTRELTGPRLGLNSHVFYIHSKFLLSDPLGADPVVVTGSANFSTASTTDNDENMLIIRGERRVADIYFTEFNRLFNHYYFRSVTEIMGRRQDPDEVSFLAETDSWTGKYAAGTLRTKRLTAYTTMHGARPG